MSTFGNKIYIEPRFCFHPIYYGPYLMVNGQYVRRGMMSWRILELFGRQVNFSSTDAEISQWEKFCEWFFYAYPIGLFLTMEI